MYMEHTNFLHSNLSTTMGETEELPKNARDRNADLHKADGLQDHQQEAWWDGDHCWCDYLERE